MRVANEVDVRVQVLLKSPYCCWLLLYVHVLREIRSLIPATSKRHLGLLLFGSRKRLLAPANDLSSVREPNESKFMPSKII